MSFISPVQYSVPAGNDYKNININNFKGTNTSDNLFDGKSSGCSESENVYINEQNILAVRPRLQHETSFENVTDILQVDSVGPDETVYYLYNKEDYTYHILILNKSNPGKQNDDVCFEVTKSGLGIEITDDFPDKCRFFRDGDGKLIWVTKYGLYEIYNTEKKDDKGNDIWSYRLIDKDHPNIYIPKTRIGMTFGNDLSGLETGETPNILGDKYERLYNYSLDSLEDIPKSYVDGKTWEIKDIISLDSVPDEITTLSSTTRLTHYSPNEYWFGDTKYFYVIKPWQDSTATNTYKNDVYNRQDLYFNGVEVSQKPNSLLDHTWWNAVHYDVGSTLKYYVNENWISSQNTTLITNEKNNSGDKDWILPRSNYKNGLSSNYPAAIEFTNEADDNQKAILRLEGWQYLREVGVNEFYRREITLKPSSINWDFEQESSFVSGEVAICSDDDNLYMSVIVTASGNDNAYVLSGSVPLTDIINSDTGNILIDTTEWTLLDVEGNGFYITDQYQTDTDIYIVLTRSDTSGGTEEGNNRSWNIRPHVIKVNKQSNEAISLFDNLINFRVVNASPACKLLPLTSTKFLIVLTDDVSVTSKLSNSTKNLRLYNSEIRCSSEYAVNIDVANKTVTYVRDDRLTDSTLYKIPNSTSFLTIKHAFNKTTNDDNTISDVTTVNVDIYTNYENQESGSFKVLDKPIYIDKNINFKLDDYTNTVFVRKEEIEDKEGKKIETMVVYAIFDDDNTNAPQEIVTLYNFTIKTNNTIKNLTEVVEPYKNKDKPIMDYTNVIMLDNRLWFFGSDTNPNKVQWTLNTSAFYVPEDFYTTVGKQEPITNITALSTDVLGVFQSNTTTVIMEDENGYYSRQRTLKTPKGCVGPNQVVIIPTTNYPLVINDDSVAVLMQSGNGVVEDSMFSILTEDIFENFAVIKDKQNIKTHVHGYYVYLYWIENKQTNIWCLDCRTNSWFKWTLPIKVKFMYETETTINEGSETETRLVTDKDEYTLTSDLYIQEGSDDSEFNEDIEAYLDYLGNRTYRRIPWKWKSRIQTLGTTNYLKKIVSLQLMFSDKVRKQKEDGVFTKNNSMFFTIKTYRKKSKLLNGSFTSHLDGVGIQRIKVRLQKCDFAEIILSNYNEDAGQLDHVNMFSNGDMILLDNESDDKFMCSEENFIYNTFDRLHLIGIMLKVLLSEGLNG